MAWSFSRRVVTLNNTTPLSPTRSRTTYTTIGIRASVVPSTTHANRSGSIKRNQACAFLGCLTARPQCGQINTVRLKYHARLPPVTRTRNRGVSFSHHGHFHLGSIAPSRSSTPAFLLHITALERNLEDEQDCAYPPSAAHHEIQRKCEYEGHYNERDEPADASGRLLGTGGRSCHLTCNGVHSCPLSEVTSLGPSRN